MTNYSYASVAQIRDEVNVQTSATTTDDGYLLDAGRFVTARLEELAGVKFAPVTESRYFDATGVHIDTAKNVLYLDQPLLAITTVTLGDGNTAANGTDFVTAPRWTPYWALRMLTSTSGKFWTTYTDDWQDAITIAGVWGHKLDYAAAWLSSSDTVEDNPLSASATSITVNDADGADVLGQTPRFSPGQLIQIESEICEVLAVDTTTEVLTVTRGALGTTAASHVQNTAITVWQPDAFIVRAAMRWAAYLYSRRGAFQRVTFDGVGTTSFPADIPAEVGNILNAAGLSRAARSAW